MSWFFLLLLISANLHACGIAFIRLLKPLAHYQEQYGDARWGIYKLSVLMDRERNRGQDGAGVAVFSSPHQEIAVDRDLSLEDLFKRMSQFKAGTMMLGHLRYSTSGTLELNQCHPFVHRDENPQRSFVLAGNFNLTNASDFISDKIKESDSFAILHMLAQSFHLDPLQTLKEAAAHWDGGYVLCQIYANGDALLCRDPAGIRPGYFFMNEEIFAAASERFALMDAFGVNEEQIHPIPPGHAIVLFENGTIEVSPFIAPTAEKSCVFERIYFSKGNDTEIYRERKALGKELAPRVFEAIDEDLAHTVFTYVPNSSQAAYLGLIGEIDHLQREKICKKILESNSFDEIQGLLSQQIREEIIIMKNQKMRTFISPDQTRGKWVSQLYEITQKIVTPEDTLVVVDDSIVRGMTLRNALIQKLIALNPKKIIFVSSAPPVQYPDCYGIDMSQLGRYIAFQAALEQFKEKGGTNPQTLSEIYDSCTLEEISAKVAQILTPENCSWTGKIQVIYQSLEGLRRAIPSSRGDWVFSGDYPTPGGFKIMNDSFANWLKNDDSRSY